ncbi:MAG: hypothetical protein ACRCXM_01065 [Beijerinckiaceae bacterium]
MLNACVTASDDVFELADTLAALVPAVVDGALRRVTVVAERPPSHATMKLIDEAGADLLIAAGDVAQRWQAYLQQNPQGWTLCLAAGVVPMDGWTDAAMRFLARAQEGERAVFQVNGGWTTRVAAGLRAIVGLRNLAAGQIVSGPAQGGRAVTLDAFVFDRRNGKGVPLIIPG